MFTGWAMFMALTVYTYLMTIQLDSRLDDAAPGAGFITSAEVTEGSSTFTEGFRCVVSVFRSFE
ncbi:hypothetical protein KIPB_015846, partial [Kipferlia bialata]|eukprot:g15846.t1